MLYTTFQTFIYLLSSCVYFLSSHISIFPHFFVLLLFVLSLLCLNFSFNFSCFYSFNSHHISSIFLFYFLYVIIITILFGAFLSSISCLTLKFILFVLTILFLIVLSSCFVAYVSDGGSIYFFLYDFSLKALVFLYRNDMYLLSYDKVF